MQRLIFVALTALVACQKAPSEAERGQVAQAASEPMIGLPQAVEASVEWPAPGTFDRLALAELKSPHREAVAHAPVPVLVPKDPALLAVGGVVAEPKFFAFSARSGGVTVSVHGVKVFHERPEIAQAAKPNRSVRSSQAFVSENEGIQSVRFLERGVAYSLEVECEAREDVRCADDRFALETAENLRYVGGIGQ